MNRNSFGTPHILGLINPSPDPDPTGGGSAGAGTHGNNGGKAPFACSFETWSEKFASDCYKDGIVDFNDYGQWWADSGLGEDAWNQFNTGLPFNWKSQNER
ncbi:MAG: hypothetical protein IKP26_08130 [Clostridia bacterium]|nr:hypothetical protein [Clostridia bacterium]